VIDARNKKVLTSSAPFFMAWAAIMSCAVFLDGRAVSGGKLGGEGGVLHIVEKSTGKRWQIRQKIMKIRQNYHLRF